MMWLVGLLLRFGLSPEAAKKVGAGIIVGGLMLLMITLVGGAWGFARYVTGLRAQTIEQRGVIQQQAAEQAATRTNDAIIGNEGVALANATQAISLQEKETDDAIHEVSPGATGAATRAANCLRWKRQHPAATAPAACRAAAG